MSNEEIIKALESVIRYEATANTCDCCGTSIEYEPYSDGGIVMYNEIAQLIKQIKGETT